MFNSSIISSYFPGRVRVRHTALKNPETVEGILAMLKFYPGLGSVSSNPQTGSLLIHYDPAQISEADLEMAASLMQAQFSQPGPEDGPGGPARGLATGLPGELLNRLDNSRLLNLAFLLTLAALLRPGGKRLHKTAGLVFSALAAAHSLRRI